MVIPYSIKALIHFMVIQVKQIGPFWLLGLAAGSVVSNYGTIFIDKLVLKGSGNRHDLIKIILAALIGAASPVTMHGMIPILAAFIKLNAGEAAVSSFIITSVLINPNVFIYSFALGAEIALLRLFICIITGITGGLLITAVFRDKKIYELKGFEVHDRNKNKIKGVLPVLESYRKAMARTAPNLALGIFLAALFQVYIPAGALDFIFRQNKGMGVLFAASLGVPAYYCGGGTIPLIKAWMGEGMSAGSAIAFMITGPATKFTNLTAVKAIMPAKNFLLYIAYNIAFGIAAGMAVDMISILIK